MAFVADRGEPRDRASSIPGVRELWALTRGSPRIRVAMIDGVVDVEHPALASSNLSTLLTVASARAGARDHGTMIAGLLFSDRYGLAPGCHGLLAPICRRRHVDARPGEHADLRAGAHRAVQSRNL